MSSSFREWPAYHDGLSLYCAIVALFHGRIVCGHVEMEDDAMCARNADLLIGSFLFLL